MAKLAGGRAKPFARGTFRSFIMFTLLNLILLANELVGRNLVVAYADEGEAGIELTRFQVPPQVKPGELRRLTCQFKLHGATLHAMKLFKDDQEFFRFTPAHQKMTFPVAGVSVDSARSRENEVWLKINKRSGGQYKCQVLIEGTFKSVSLAKRMEVVLAEPGQGAATATTLGGAWQHHPVPHYPNKNQHEDLAGTKPHLSRQPHSAVQQHPSHLYGLSSVLGGGASSGGFQVDSRGGIQLSASSLAVLAWSLLVATLAAITFTTTSTSLLPTETTEHKTRKRRKRKRRKRPREKI